MNDFWRRERAFLLIFALSLFVVGLFYDAPSIAMWLGFGFAAYSAVANDSIQTIGTFISSNSHRKWWILWLFMGGIFVATVTYSWVTYDGDVSYQRLTTKGFDEQPSAFHYLQVAAPVFLILLTRLRMPVSTTFLLLSSFSATPSAIGGVLQKSMMGYLIAFAVAFIVWLALSRLMRGWFQGRASVWWTVAQWLTSGYLWSLWIQHDAANIAVYLPRNLSTIEFLAFTLTIALGLAFIFKNKGGNIQKVINEKSEVVDVRPATVIDFVYMIIILVFKEWSTVPMSTTWVFIGLLGGRELGIRTKFREQTSGAWRMLGLDLLRAFLGLLVSIIIAIAANNELREGLMETFGF